MPKEIISLNSFTKGDCVVNGNFLLDESTSDLCTLVDYSNCLELNPNPNHEYIPEDFPIIQYIYRDCGIDVDTFVPECSLVLNSYTLDVPVIKTVTVIVNPKFATCKDFGYRDATACNCNPNTEVTMYQKFNPYTITPDGKYMVNPLSGLKCCECWKKAECKKDFNLSTIDECRDYVNNWEFSHRNYDITNCDIKPVYIPDGMESYYRTKTISKDLDNCSTCDCESSNTNKCPPGETCEWYGGIPDYEPCDAPYANLNSYSFSWKPWGSCLTCKVCIPNCNVCASDDGKYPPSGEVMTADPMDCERQGKIPRGSTCPILAEEQVNPKKQRTPCFECIDCEDATNEEKTQYYSMCIGDNECRLICGNDYHTERPTWTCPTQCDQDGTNCRMYDWFYDKCSNPDDPSSVAYCWHCEPVQTCLDCSTPCPPTNNCQGCEGPGTYVDNYFDNQDPDGVDGCDLTDHEIIKCPSCATELYDCYYCKPTTDCAQCGYKELEDCDDCPKGTHLVYHSCTPEGQTTPKNCCKCEADSDPCAVCSYSSTIGENDCPSGQHRVTRTCNTGSTNPTTGQPETTTCFECVDDDADNCKDPTFAKNNACQCTGVGCAVDCVDLGCQCPGGGSGNSNPQCGVGYINKRCSAGPTTPTNPSGFNSCEFCEYCEKDPSDPCGSGSCSSYTSTPPTCGSGLYPETTRCGNSSCYTGNCVPYFCSDIGCTTCPSNYVFKGYSSQTCPSGYHDDQTIATGSFQGISCGGCYCCKEDSCSACGSQYSKTPQTNCPSGQVPTLTNNPPCGDAGFTNCYYCSY